MSKNYLLIELSHVEKDGELIDVIIEINHPENLIPFSEPCKDHNVINANVENCLKIRSWMRLFGIFAILDDSDHNHETPLIMELCDGSSLHIDGWEILDQKGKDALIDGNQIDPEIEDDKLKLICEFSDSVTLTKLPEEKLKRSVIIATHKSHSSNFDLVLECLFDKNKTYALYTGSFHGADIKAILSAPSLLPSMVVHQSDIVGECITCNALELFKGSVGSFDVASEHIDTFSHLDVSEFETKPIEMDYIELQVVESNGDMFVFMGNDPSN